MQKPFLILAICLFSTQGLLLSPTASYAEAPTQGALLAFDGFDDDSNDISNDTNDDDTMGNSNSASNDDDSASAPIEEDSDGFRTGYSPDNE